MGVRRMMAVGVATVVAAAGVGFARGDGARGVVGREMTVERVMEERARLGRAWLEALNEKDYARAEGLLRELVPLDAENFVPWYNLACVLALQGKAEEGIGMLRQAVMRGFSDRRRAEGDPHLAGLRGTPEWDGLMAGWAGLVEAGTRARLERLEKRYRVGEAGSAYRRVDEPGLGVVVISAFGDEPTRGVVDEMRRLGRWWERYVVADAPPLPPPPTPPTPPTPRPLPSRDAAAAQGEGRAVPVVVLLPTREDYLDWAVLRFGERAERVGGVYEHDQRRLIAMDLGPTLRHEFWHVLHWRDMDARGQRHPMWVMEGLCSLVEDVGAGEGEAMTPRASWRTNIVRRLARAGNLTAWERLFAMDQRRFMGARASGNYAEARAVFMFLHERGKLGAFYAAYVEGFAGDASGLEAMGRAFGKPAREVEKEFRAWARGLEEVSEQVGRGRANLPVNVGPGNGDGPVVMDDGVEALLRGRDPASRQGLRARDVIVEIDGKAVADLNDLARVLGEKDEGETVEVVVRRRDGSKGAERVSVRVRLVGAGE